MATRARPAAFIKVSRTLLNKALRSKNFAKVLLSNSQTDIERIQRCIRALEAEMPSRAELRVVAGIAGVTLYIAPRWIDGPRVWDNWAVAHPFRNHEELAASLDSHDFAQQVLREACVHFPFFDKE